MGSSNERRKNVAPLARGGSVVTGSGQINLDCRFSAIVAASLLNGATQGAGRLQRDGDDIVLTSGEVDIAQLDRADSHFDQLANCLDVGSEFVGTLSARGSDVSVHVRPGA